MNHTDVINQLQVLIRSRYTLIVLKAEEEKRADRILLRLAHLLDIPLMTWVRTKGLQNNTVHTAVYGTLEPLHVLEHIESSNIPALYHLKDLFDYLDDRVLVQKVRDLADHFANQRGAIVISGSDPVIPGPLAPHCAVVTLPSPTAEEYEALLGKVINNLKKRGPVEVSMGPADIMALIQNIRGLTLMEAEKIFTTIIIEDGRLSPEDVQGVLDAKKAIVEKEGILEYIHVEERMADVADLVHLKQWLKRRETLILQPERAKNHNLPFPKGILLVGVPGCGKSLCAKVTAAAWNKPLLRFDPSTLYDKYIGESEKKFHHAMALSERLAPVVLWIDEIEKAFASSSGEEDGGLSRRILGTFLSWLQDRVGEVFIIATANDVFQLPPELMRKGRFDEIFFVDLPDRATRAAIFGIHLSRHECDPADFNISLLSAASEGFSGSEIEQCVISGLYTALAAGEELSTGVLMNEIARTHPLSVTMDEKIATLRRWAKGRTVPAN